MELNIDPEWLRQMAEKEDGCILSTGGLVVAMKHREELKVQKAPTSLNELMKGVPIAIMSKEELIASVVLTALDKGLGSEECYSILKKEGYSDADLQPVFLIFAEALSEELRRRGGAV